MKRRTHLQLRQHAMAWGLYLASGMTRSLASYRRNYGHHLTQRRQRQLDRVIMILDGLFADLLDDMKSFREENRRG